MVCCKGSDIRPWLPPSCFPFIFNHSPPCCLTIPFCLSMHSYVVMSCTWIRALLPVVYQLFLSFFYWPWALKHVWTEVETIAFNCWWKWFLFLCRATWVSFACMTNCTGLCGCFWFLEKLKLFILQKCLNFCVCFSI